MKTLFDEYDESPTVKTKSIGGLMKNYKLGTKKTEHEFEFQEVCKNLEKDFSKLVWTLPHKKGITEYKLRKAGEIARQRGITKFPYLVGILKRLP